MGPARRQFGQFSAVVAARPARPQVVPTRPRKVAFLDSKYAPEFSVPDKTDSHEIVLGPAQGTIIEDAHCRLFAVKESRAQEYAECHPPNPRRNQTRARELRNRPSRKLHICTLSIRLNTRSNHTANQVSRADFAHQVSPYQRRI